MPIILPALHTPSSFLSTPVIPFNRPVKTSLGQYGLPPYPKSYNSNDNTIINFDTNKMWIIDKLPLHLSIIPIGLGFTNEC